MSFRALLYAKLEGGGRPDQRHGSHRREPSPNSGRIDRLSHYPRPQFFDPLPTDEEESVSRLASTLAIIFRLARPYFFSEDRWAGRVLLAAVIAIELSIVAINIFIERTLALSFGLLSAIVTLFSFMTILWMLSAAAPLHVFGSNLAIPGYLVWAALLYAVVGTTLTHLIGWPLVSLNFRQQRFEADFRFNLVRLRENSEQIALLGGGAAQPQRLLDRFL